VCRSKVIREGSQIIIAESEVFDRRKGKEVLVAKAMVTLMAVPREKISPEPRNGRNGSLPDQPSGHLRPPL
jgi:hypothetical protein